MSSVSKIVLVLVVLHGQNCVVNENCLYKAILKIFLACLNVVLGMDKIV